MVGLSDGAFPEKCFDGGDDTNDVERRLQAGFPGGVAEDVGQLVAEGGSQPVAKNGSLWTLGTDE